MVKKAFISIFTIIAAFAFSIYPNLTHPPIWTFKDDIVTLDFETPVLTAATITILAKEDEFEIFDSTSLHHMVRIPYKGDFEYKIEISSGERYSGKVVYPSKKLKKFRMLFVGDSRDDDWVLKRIVNLSKNEADFMVHLGDIAFADLFDKGWNNFFEAVSDFGKIVFTVKGNHEFPGLRYSLYLYKNAYTFRIGKYRFISLGYNTLPSLLKVQIKDFLDKYKNEDSYKILLMHLPIFTCEKSSLSHMVVPSSASELLELLKKHNVKLVVSSHSHNYQRIENDGITFLIIGGGGANLHEIDKNCQILKKGFVGYSYAIFNFSEDKIKVTAYDIDKNKIDEFTIGF